MVKGVYPDSLKIAQVIHIPNIKWEIKVHALITDQFLYYLSSIKFLNEAYTIDYIHIYKILTF